MSSPFGSAGDGKDFPRYEPTNHPEDRPDYGLPSYGSYNAGGNAGYDEQPQGGVGYNGPVYNGPVSATKAIGWAFRTVFSNWQLWILGSLLMLAVFGIFGAVVGFILASNGDGNAAFTGNIFSNVITQVISLLVSLFVMRLALFQIDDLKTGWSYIGKDVRWGNTFLMLLIIAVVSFLVMGLGVMVFGGTAFATLTSADVQDEEAALAAAGTVFGILAVLVIISWLVTPLYKLMPWFAADGDSIGDSIKKGFTAGKANYLQLLLYALMMFGLGIACILTLGLGFFIFAPVSLLAEAHLFRQCAGRYTPA